MHMIVRRECLRRISARMSATCRGVSDMRSDTSPQTRDGVILMRSVAAARPMRCEHVPVRVQLNVLTCESSLCCTLQCGDSCTPVLSRVCACVASISTQRWLQFYSCLACVYLRVCERCGL